MFITGALLHFPHMLGFELPLPLMYSPFLYLYAASLTHNRPWKLNSLLHFLPALGMYGLLIPFFRLPPAQKIYVYQHQGEGFEWLTDINRYAIIASGVTYIALTLLMLRRHRKKIKDEFSNTEKINLNWLRYLAYGTSAIWIVIISGLHDEWIYATAAVFVFFLGYFGIRQVGIFSNIHPKTIPPDSSALLEEVKKYPEVKPGIETDENEARELIVEAKVKYQKSALTEEDAMKIHQRLTAVMMNEALFKNPELTLADVAGKLGVHPNILSQVINSVEKKSFYDYINGLRIEEFKKVTSIPDHRQFTLLALAFECGFNSKTAFNRNFKKATGLSPTEYLTQQQVILARD
jgi:AraC-like DNA-binding protein